VRDCDRQRARGERERESERESARRGVAFAMRCGNAFTERRNTRTSRYLNIRRPTAASGVAVVVAVVVVGGADRRLFLAHLRAATTANHNNTIHTPLPPTKCEYKTHEIIHTSHTKMCTITSHTVIRTNAVRNITTRHTIAHNNVRAHNGAARANGGGGGGGGGRGAHLWRRRHFADARILQRFLFAFLQLLVSLGKLTRVMG